MISSVLRQGALQSINPLNSGIVPITNYMSAELSTQSPEGPQVKCMSQNTWLKLLNVNFLFSFRPATKVW